MLYTEILPKGGKFGAWKKKGGGGGGGGGGGNGALVFRIEASTMPNGILISVGKYQG